jgi:hypothetical protein
LARLFGLVVVDLGVPEESLFDTSDVNSHSYAPHSPMLPSSHPNLHHFVTSARAPLNQPAKTFNITA